MENGFESQKTEASISTNPKQNSLTSPYHHSQISDKLLISPIKGED